MNRSARVLLTLLLVLSLLVAVWLVINSGFLPLSKDRTLNLPADPDLEFDEDSQLPLDAPDSLGIMLDGLPEDMMLDETSSMESSSNKDWWLSSGGLIYASDGVAKTVQGELPQDSKWRLAYSKTNPIDTDDGHHPQNIFRLVTRNQWLNCEQQVYFKINRCILSDSSNRNQSNGLFLFNRYQGEDSLYYAGIRVDGAVVIKKKEMGKYYTIAYKRILDGKYDRNSTPNLLPENTWIGVKTQVVTQSGDKVRIRLYVDVGRTGSWMLALEVRDSGNTGGEVPILGGGYGGIRTDFMDVEFDDYLIAEYC